MSPPIPPLPPPVGTASPHEASSCQPRADRLQVLDLSTTNPALLDIKGPESLSSLWGVLTRCKKSIKDGERLENISWRLWYQACVNASISYGHAQSALDTHPLTPSSSHSDTEEHDLDASRLRAAQPPALNNSKSAIDADEWLSESESAASSDSEVAVSTGQSTSHPSTNPTSKAAKETAEDEIEGEEDFVTDSEGPSSPETPPPPPLPTKPIFKNQSSSAAIRSKSKVNIAAATAEGKNSTVRAKKAVTASKGLVKKQSIGGKVKPSTKRADSNISQETGLIDRTESLAESERGAKGSLDVAAEEGTNVGTVQSENRATSPATQTTNSTIAPIAAAQNTTASAYSSSTPKASSYPTPSQSYIPSQSHGAGSSASASVHAPPGFARSRSHLDTGPSTRHSHSGRLDGEWANIWSQWRRAGERSFGEVVDDVFKVVRVEDLVPQRVQSNETVATSENSVEAHDSGCSVGNHYSERAANHLAQDSVKGKLADSGFVAWDPLSSTFDSNRPPQIINDEISPRTTPGVHIDYKESPLRAKEHTPDPARLIGNPTIVSPAKGISESPETDVTMTDSRRVSTGTIDEANTSNPATPGHAISIGPVVRIVEPTPAPSRVGSAGEMPHLGGRLSASSAINHGFSRLKQHSQSGRRRASAGRSAPEISSTRSSPVPSHGGMETSLPMDDTDLSMENRPSGIRRTSSDRSDESQLSGGASTLGSPRIEIEDPMEMAGAQQKSPTSQKLTSQQSPLLSSSVLRQLNDAATSRSEKTVHKKQRHPEQQHSHGSQQSGKKNKKSIFFIQSPGDNRTRQASARHGSVSGGSEASTDPDGGSFAGSSVGLAGSGSAKSPNRHRLSSVASAATSPLSREIQRSNVTEGKKLQPVEQSEGSDTVRHDKHVFRETPAGPSRAASDMAAPLTNRRTSGPSKTSHSSTNLKRTASTAHASAHGHGHGNGHGHRTSVHHLTHVTGGHAKNHTTAAANAGGAKRIESMSSMSGKLKEMKASAAAAINARLEAQQRTEKEKQTEQRNKLLAAKRQRSEPDLLAAQQRILQEAEPNGDDDDDDDDAYEDIENDVPDDNDDGWSSASPESAKITGLQIGKVKPKPKRDPLAIAAAKAAAAEEDAKRKRELFAKRAIFGTGGMSGMSLLHPPAPPKDIRPDALNAPVNTLPRPGGLTNLFEKQRDVLRRGDSMVSLMEPSHSVPPQVHATAGTRQREGTSSSGPGFTLLNRSKSAAALPVASGVSVTTGGLMTSGLSIGKFLETEAKTTPIRGKLRLPPKPKEDADFSPSSSPDNTSSMLATSQAVRRLEALTNNRRPSAHSNKSQEVVETAGNGSVISVQPSIKSVNASALTSELERVRSNPMPMQQHVVQFVEPALPETPTTRRRQMLATELPEDLRLNLLWERRSREPAFKGGSNLRATASAHDLPEAARDAEYASTALSRQTSHNPSDQPSSRRETSPNDQTQPPPRRRSGPNLLSGGNLLRPLTSASTATSTTPRGPSNNRQESSEPPARQPLQRDQRSKSSANVADLSRVDAHRGVGFAGWGGPDLLRRSTDGDKDVPAAEQRLARHKTLRDREGELSSSFRSHGW
ncbi:hypothetical protein QFC21_006892 [Naganishia friedmannii]|uniref:Uncharacterized protein n=1 Tax=Naganishia friedmannii TaxID=89922 RepID=A0ACC2UZU0_9TREE|nr:hypothetical protein QFC21_006892 [Naganishia friedmannii]